MLKMPSLYVGLKEHLIPFLFYHLVILFGAVNVMLHLRAGEKV